MATGRFEVLQGIDSYDNARSCRMWRRTLSVLYTHSKGIFHLGCYVVSSICGVNTLPMHAKHSRKASHTSA
eukprot:5575566-Amphidinium_carterae.1